MSELMPYGQKNWTEMAEKDWKNSTSRCFGVILDGRAPISGVRRKGSDVTLLLIASADNEMIKFKLPPGTGGHAWERLLDTGSFGSTAESAGTTLACGAIAEIGAHSISLFKLLNNSRS
jgi:isoamylase